jgi:hypothetical protein
LAQGAHPGESRVACVNVQFQPKTPCLPNRRQS